MQYINIVFILYITCSIQKRAFISLHISTVGVVRLYFKSIVKFDQTTFYFWTISNKMHHKLCSLCKRHLLFQRQQELWLALLKIYCNLIRDRKILVMIVDLHLNTNLRIIEGWKVRCKRLQCKRILSILQTSSMLFTVKNTAN